MKTNYAGFLQRVAAYIIDGVILSIPYYAMIFAFGGMPKIDPETGEATTGGLYTAFMITMVLWIVYYAYFESSESQATIGKRLMKIRVTDMDGNRLSMGGAVIRNLAKLLSSIILGIGFLMAAFTQRKQGLHDIIAKTLVLTNSENKSGGDLNTNL